jgi:DHA2 family multidrug resistance protein
MALMPLVGSIGPKVDVRWMISIGYAVIGVSLWIMGGFSLAVSFGDIAWARMIQGIGLALTFVPINTLAYAYVARHLRNEASALLSLARNVGASIGISVTAALLSRGEQVHQAYLVAHATPYDSAYHAAVAQAGARALAHGGDPVAAAITAQNALAQTIGLQANLLSFVDQFGFIALGVLLMIPPIVLMRRPSPPAIPAART